MYDKEKSKEKLLRYIEYIEQLAADCRKCYNDEKFSYGLDAKFEGIKHWSTKAQKEIDNIKLAENQ